MIKLIISDRGKCLKEIKYLWCMTVGREMDIGAEI